MGFVRLEGDSEVICHVLTVCIAAYHGNCLFSNAIYLQSVGTSDSYCRVELLT